MYSLGFREFPFSNFKIAFFFQFSGPKTKIPFLTSFRDIFKREACL